jgi:hypothetical protein
MEPSAYQPFYRRTHTVATFTYEHYFLAKQSCTSDACINLNHESVDTLDQWTAAQILLEIEQPSLLVQGCQWRKLAQMLSMVMVLLKA